MGEQSSVMTRFRHRDDDATLGESRKARWSCDAKGHAIEQLSVLEEGTRCSQYSSPGEPS